MNKEEHYFAAKMFHRMMWPALIAGISHAVSDTIDAVALGSGMGAEGLAAIGIVTPLYILFNVIGYGFSVGGSVQFSQNLAEGRRKEAVRQFNVTVELMLVVSVIIAIAANLLMKPLLFLLGVSAAEGELYRLCADYAGIMMSFTPVFLLNLVLYDYLKSDNGQILAAISTVVGCILDVSLNIVLVIILDYGVKGSIWSTVIALCVSVAIMLMHFARRKDVLEFQFFIPSKEEIKQCIEGFRIGLSTSVKDLYQLVFELTVNNLLLRLAAGNGTLYVAAFNVVLNVSYITCCAADAVVSAIQPLTATFYAEQNRDNLSFSMKQALRWGIILTAVIALLIGAGAESVAGLFGMRDSMTVYAIRVFCVGTVFDAAITVFAGLLQSIEDEKTAGRIISIRYLYLLLPLTIGFTLIHLSWFWFVIPTTAIISCILMAGTVRKVLRQLAAEQKEVLTYTLSQEKDMGELIDKIIGFCKEQKTTMQQMNLVNMAVEEICMVILHNAFAGAENEYIQVTVFRENEKDFVLHIRDSAISYNPFDVKVSRWNINEQDYMDNVGILMVRGKAKSFDYRRYQGFNVVTITV